MIHHNYNNFGMNYVRNTSPILTITTKSSMFQTEIVDIHLMPDSAHWNKSKKRLTIYGLLMTAQLKKIIAYYILRVEPLATTTSPTKQPNTDRELTKYMNWCVKRNGNQHVNNAVTCNYNLQSIPGTVNPPKYKILRSGNTVRNDTEDVATPIRIVQMILPNNQLMILRTSRQLGKATKTT